MDNDNQSPRKTIIGWLTTPPQAYAVFLAAAVLIYLASFYAGTLSPRTPMHMPPGPNATAPAR